MHNEVVLVSSGARRAVLTNAVGLEPQQHNPSGGARDPLGYPRCCGGLLSTGQRIEEPSWFR